MVLPLTVLRRLDGVLAPTKERVLERYAGLPKRFDAILNRITGVQFNNTSELDLRKVLDDPQGVADQLRQYVAGFSEEVREVFEKFDLDAQISRLDAANLLYLVLGKFVEIDLGPENVSNTAMGYIYEELRELPEHLEGKRGDALGAKGRKVQVPCYRSWARKGRPLGADQVWVPLDTEAC